MSIETGLPIVYLDEKRGERIFKILLDICAGG
jgi:hypothetical protein